MLKRHDKVFLSLVVAFVTALAAASSAQAVTPAVGWAISGETTPTTLRPGSEASLKLLVFNVGAAEETSPGAILTDTLPTGLTALGTSRTFIYGGTAHIAECQVATGHEIKCELSALQRVYDKFFEINIGVKVSADVEGSGVNRATVTGGGALTVASTSFPVTFGTTAASSGFANVNAWITNADGTEDAQAGSHPYELATSFDLNTAVNEKEELASNDSFLSEAPAGGELRDLNVNLPPGIVGDPEAVPRCTRQQLDTGYSGSCPDSTQVGWNYATINGLGYNELPSAVYNMVPPPGVAAQFGFSINHELVFLDSGVRTGGDNGITVHADDLPENELTSSVTIIWGIPGEASHDPERKGAECESPPQETCSVHIGEKPFLTLPTSCGAAPEVSMEELGTWQDEAYVSSPAKFALHDSKDNPIGFTGCESLRPFKPEVSIAPDTTYSDTPAGLSVSVKMPQGLNPEGYGAPGLQNTTVVLPEGIAINPGQATGLQACQPFQEALGDLPDGEVNEGPVSCPSASKVGTDEITTPLLPNKLQGNVYILGSDPPNLQMLIAASGEGVNLKLVGTVHLDENTGQLTTTFDKTPDFPFTEFKLAFSGGAQAALATPTKCGVYESTADFTPWATPFIEDALDTSRFQIDGGPGGSSCVWPMPFAPTMTAGATTDQAGGYTSFTMLLQRGDEQQRIKNLSFKTPEGLLGMISKVPLCGEAEANAGSCPAASQIGHTVVGTGPGPYPFYIPQASAPPAPIYLTGPYKGAPFGLSIVVPLIAGPFNLGTEIVRARIEVDSRTSQITVTTDPLPQVVKGIPTDLREIDAVIDRPEFMFNPTSCAPKSFSGTATSVEGATAPLASHFQVGSCQALKFQPDFKVATSGKTSRANGASLTARIVYPVGNLGFNQASSQSSIKSVKVDLPKQLPSRLTTLQKACPAKVFEANPASCPADSIVGHGKVITPLLPVPVEGPAYFVSHADEEFPNLIVVLQGDNVTVDLVGSTFIDSKTNITSSTFKEVPDVPIQSFELNLPQGPYSALAANTNLCKVKGGLKIPTAFTGQNGAVIHQSTTIDVTGCAKSKPKKAKKHKQSSKGHKTKKK
jgi:hypothetical protein